MIDEALSFLSREMNDYFKTKLETVTDAKVILSGLVGQDGSLQITGENKVVITLVNIEREPVVKNSLPAGRFSDGGAAQPLTINLHLLFSAYALPANYVVSLKLISLVIAFFQEKGTFTVSKMPRMNSGIEKLTFDMESPGIEKLNNLWATLGAKYMPSVLYKMRMLTYNEATAREYRPAISSTDSGGNAI